MSSAPAAATAAAPAPASNGAQANGTSHDRPAKRPNNANRNGNNRKSKQQRTKRERNITEGSSEEILRCDIEALLKSRREAADTSKDDVAVPVSEADLPEPFTEIEVQIHELSSTGDGLGMVAGSDQVYVVPFAVPGDTVRIKVIRHVRGEGHSHADFLSVVAPSPLRDDSRIKCQYFARCGGCQFQMLDYAEQLHRKRRIVSCETDSKATTTEYIGDYIFTNPAGSFFQNNNSILPIFTTYIRDRILPAAAAADKPIKYLIDAYSGSGLFTITLSSVFQHSVGIDIAGQSIEYARSNAALNGLGEDRCRFIAADAAELFASVTYDADETVVVLDPPRKGCDASFLAQLRRFGPRRVLYVSCNVHTQARDVGVLVRGEGEGRRYAVESLVGFDFFPQTGHVEGVAILNRVEE
ncbi:hypothetical protein LLEC1_06243 [Akanthomyces lecanii]|uniref:tRNA (uracil(54)-C(5))-methyltransferase n=1 Tax=Cordyceps confragosa TaxID=2714763 RepID=A0A179I874_CORDF|nr:hypothetical protein LLEC1_06243 [Akanthomyces lecanii]